MSISMQPSLFEPSGANALGDATNWIAGTLLGTVAITLCVLAVAFVGLLMLTGRLPIREGIRVALGCFILLGAPVIASAFVGSLQPTVAPPPPEPPPPPPDPRGDLPPSGYDPYAGASLRDG